MSGNSDNSLYSIHEKQYEEVSVQAYEIINDKTTSTKKVVDFSAVEKGTLEGNSNFTTLFNKTDKSVQGNLERPVNQSIQADRGQGVNQSQQYGNYLPVNQSQQYSLGKAGVNQSAQMSLVNSGNNQSQQYGNGEYLQDQSMQMDNVGFDVSIQNTISQRQGKGVDMSIQKYEAVELVDRSMQKTVHYADQSIQPSL